MTTLRELVKDRKVYSVEATRTVLEAARFMMEHNIGALHVLRGGWEYLPPQEENRHRDNHREKQPLVHGLS